MFRATKSHPVADALDKEQAARLEESSEDSHSESDPTTSNQSVKSATSNSSTEPITRQETKAVNRSKILVYVALVLAAAAVGALTYVFMAREETATFHAEFFMFAHEVTDMTNENARTIMGQLHTLATATTSYANASGLAWPNVSVPHFDIRTGEAEDLSGIELIVFSPIVAPSQLSQWEAYAWEHQDWIAEALLTRGWNTVHAGNISAQVYSFTEDMNEIKAGLHDGHDRHLAESTAAMHLPVWQFGPVPTDASIINLDLYTHPSFKRMANDVLEIRHDLISDVVDLRFLLQHTELENANDGHPRSYIMQPVFDHFEDKGRQVVGFMIGELAWEAFFVNLLPTNTPGVLVDIKGTCGSEFTYVIEGHHASYVGEGDLHDPRYDSLKMEFEFAEFARYDGEDDDLGGVHCEYTIAMYPTHELEAPYHTSAPAVYAAIVVLVFFFTAMVFALYDYMVYRRQQKLLATAKRTGAIVSSLFPKDVQKRIMEDADRQAQEEEGRKNGKALGFAAKNQLKTFLDGDEVRSTEGVFKTKPIADLFPQVTIMFADIVGFTAWSSMREPSQVFMLLESIYHEFDQIAKRRRVFKVETVGDCYVAVAGLPEPRKDHATIMARFARDCNYKFIALTKHLEVALGPDTAELGMRFGLHSGPVTAGVLRGERARFQLFGDTMNTTARIESTGSKNKIHISQETADLLSAAGKGHWMRPREDKVVAKGKGELTTFWLELRGDSARSSRSGTSSDSGGTVSNSDEDAAALSRPSTVTKGSTIMSSSLKDKHMRLVDWNTEIMARLLKEIVVRREACGTEADRSSVLDALEDKSVHTPDIVLDELKDVIDLPSFNCSAAQKQREVRSVELGKDVMDQLRDYITAVAAMYRENAFHNFEHASHVTMSVVKLLARIVAPDIQPADASNVEKDLHDHTYGITSDPLTQFAVIFSALIHDVDHTGVPNSQLVKEQAIIAAVYKNKSVAEQNSVDIAWELLMQDGYRDLRRVIYSNADEFQRFRQLVVNAVLATDIMDKELSQTRKNRWNKAFAEGSMKGLSESDVVNRKATIVIEHLIQASDVAHTMQHWHIYRKWNARLFEEMYSAYLEGRAEVDPSTIWYEGEIGFFDYYIIPLAMKLRSCGVFGVSSDEYLNYAQQNRREWESKGRELVAEMLDTVKSEAEVKSMSK